MSFVDTHCHIDMIRRKSKSQFENYFAWMKELGFDESPEKVIHISCDPQGIQKAIELAESDPNIYFGAGIHPHDAKDYSDKIHQKLQEAIEHPKALAWGEFGLDYFYDNSPRNIQQEVFIRQLVAAQKTTKPLILHLRDAEEDALQIMQEHLDKDYPVHVHCFTGSQEFAQNLLQNFSNLYFGFTGVITFNSTQSLRDTLATIPQNRILVETDAPFMAPVPFRGKTCHSGMIPSILEKIAEVWDEDLIICEEKIRANTKQLFGI